MIAAACILLPLVFAAATRFLPSAQAIGPAAALLNLALAGSLPWLAGPFGIWLLPTPIAALIATLTAFAWLIASAADVLDGLEQPGASIAILVGCLNLALLSASPVLTVLAMSAAGLAAIQALRPTPAALPTAAISASGLAVFGAALISNGPPATGAGSLFVLLGLGCLCLLTPVWATLNGMALPRSLAMLIGPFGATWLATSLRVPGLAPGVPLIAGASLLLFATHCLWRKSSAALPSAATIAFLGTTLAAFGAGAAASGLLHLTLGCLALTAALTSGWPAVVGLAALTGIPPLGVFASDFSLLTETASRSIPQALLFAAALLAFLLAALRHLPLARPATRAAPLGWLALALTLATGWLLPPGIAAWIHNMAAAAQ